MNLTIGKWCFCPSLIVSLLTLVGVVLFFSLGCWQLNRAEYKRGLHELFLNQQTKAAIDLNQFIDHRNDKKNLWRRVFVTGHFHEKRQILLDNQVMQGESGYFVYTPFRPKNSDIWLLVNRGWVAGRNDRSTVPAIVRTDSEVTINGVLKEAPKTGILLKGATPEKMTHGIMRVQKIDLSQLEGLLDIALSSLIIRLEPNSEYGYIRNWRLPSSGEKRSLGYAFQWFAFAMVSLLIYLFTNVKKIDEMEKADE